jgi:hypothetical protein
MGAVGFEQSAKVPEIDQNLTRLIAAWTNLPEWIKAGIMAMVNSAK